MEGRTAKLGLGGTFPVVLEMEKAFAKIEQ